LEMSRTMWPKSRVVVEEGGAGTDVVVAEAAVAGGAGLDMVRGGMVALTRKGKMEEQKIRSEFKVAKKTFLSFFFGCPFNCCWLLRNLLPHSTYSSTGNDYKHIISGGSNPELGAPEAGFLCPSSS
jgi:hypothetical protein